MSETCPIHLRILFVYKQVSILLILLKDQMVIFNWGNAEILKLRLLHDFLLILLSLHFEIFRRLRLLFLLLDGYIRNDRVKAFKAGALVFLGTFVVSKISGLTARSIPSQYLVMVGERNVP